MYEIDIILLLVVLHLLVNIFLSKKRYTFQFYKRYSSPFFTYTSLSYATTLHSYYTKWRTTWKRIYEKFNSVKKKRKLLKASSQSLWARPTTCDFRNFCDATGPRPNCVVRFAVQIIYLLRQQIARILEGTPRTTVPKATGSPFWSQIRTTSPRIRTQGGRVVLRVQRRTIRKHRYWILVISSLLQGRLNLRITLIHRFSILVPLTRYFSHAKSVAPWHKIFVWTVMERELKLIFSNFNVLCLSVTSAFDIIQFLLLSEEIPRS